MIEVFIGLGSNLGDRRKFLKEALKKIKQLKGVRFDKVSSIYQSQPQAAIGPDYLNCVLKINTTLKAEVLLDKLQKIEIDLGRRRYCRNCPRTIDLDILFYGKKEIKTKRLIIPHPKIKFREFVKKPLFEIEPKLKSF